MSTKTTTATINKVITGKGRLSYAFIWEPREQDDNQSKYSTTFLIPKGDTKTIDAIKSAMNKAAKEGKEKLWGGQLPANLKLPLRDGDKETDKGEEYAGHYFINASTKNAPGIVDCTNQRITDHDEVYSGCYARISVNFFPFNSKGNKGIGCGLNNIQKLADGEPLGGTREKAENEFGAYEDPAAGDLPFGDDDDILVA